MILNKSKYLFKNMENISINFIYKSQEIKILSKSDENMKDIFKNFFGKINEIENSKNFFFI